MEDAIGADRAVEFLNFCIHLLTLLLVVAFSILVENGDQVGNDTAVLVLRKYCVGFYLTSKEHAS